MVLLITNYVIYILTDVKAYILVSQISYLKISIQCPASLPGMIFKQQINIYWSSLSLKNKRIQKLIQ